jgi:hypothetical protein
MSTKNEQPIHYEITDLDGHVWREWLYAVEAEDYALAGWELTVIYD